MSLSLVAGRGGTSTAVMAVVRFHGYARDVFAWGTVNTASSYTTEAGVLRLITCNRLYAVSMLSNGPALTRGARARARLAIF